MPEYVRDPWRVALGVYRGLRFGLILHPQYAPEVYLEGATTRLAMLSREHHGPRAVLNALARLAGGYGSECARVRQDLAIAAGQLHDYQARLGAPFAHDDYLSQHSALRDQLKSGLSGAAPERAAGAVPGASELADQIRAITAAHSIEATPERGGKRRSSAQGPVTARIRRRTEALSASDPAPQQDVAASTAETSLLPPPVNDT